jgi:hypothetical protein
MLRGIDIPTHAARGYARPKGRNVVKSPVRQLAENSGVGSSIMVGKLTDKGQFVSQ